MYRLVLQLFCIFNLIIIIPAAEYDNANMDNQVYNLHRLYHHFYFSHTLKDKSLIFANSLVNNLKRDFIFEPYEYVLQNSTKCVKDILYTFESLGNFSNLWALRIIDSFAKPPGSGILQGNFKWVGDYNECIKVYAPPKALGSTTGNFYGQYCSLTYTLSLHNNSLPLTFGLCLPDSCSTEDLQEKIMHLLFKAGGFPVVDDEPSITNKIKSISCMPRERPLNAAAKCVIALLSIFCAFILMGSTITAVKHFKKLWKQKGSSLVINISDQEHIVDLDNVPQNDVESEDVSLIQNDLSENKGFLYNCETFLSCFCVFTNGAKLLNTDSSEGQLLCIHGIRFLSMSWIILGHTYAFCTLVSRNILEMVDVVIDDFAFQIVLQGAFAVDSFFVLSGFLLSYLSMNELSRRKGSINWLYFYTHRYIRLTPIYMVVLGFSATIVYYLGSGPFWPLGDHDPNCRKTWWRNLLYINNFTELTEQCMGWSWYLANDMQFFIISPIFLISLWRWPKIGYVLLGLFLVSSVFSNFFITYKFDLMAGMFIFTSKDIDVNQIMLKFSDYFEELYIKPYTRIGPYLIGIILGYILFKHKTTNKPKLNWVYLCIGWIVAIAVTLTCVYGLYHDHPSLLARSIYNASSRICFAFGLSWVIYVCLIDQGGVINSILSYKLFIPLSRLTYSAYLIHLLIVMGYYNSLKRPFEFSHLSVVVVYLGIMVVTYAVSLPVSLILESPVVSLEKLIRNKFNEVQKTESRN